MAVSKNEAEAVVDSPNFTNHTFRDGPMTGVDIPACVMAELHKHSGFDHFETEDEEGEKYYSVPAGT